MDWLATPLARMLMIGGSLAVLLAIFLMQLLPGLYRIELTDFQSFYDASVTVGQGGDPYAPTIAWINTYVPTGNGTGFSTKSYVYAPFFALALFPLTLLPKAIAFGTWDALNLAFLVGAVWAGLRASGQRASTQTVLTISAGAALTAAVRKEWYLGQADIFLIFLICAALWARTARRAELAGALLGVACVTKPALALLVVFLLWKREFRLVIVSGVVFAALFGLPFTWLGARIWEHQWTVWSFWSNQYLAFAHNDAAKGILTRLFTVNPVVHPLVVAPFLVTALWLPLAAAVALLTLAGLSTAPLGRDGRSLLEAGLVLEGVLLITPLMEWPYMLLLLLPFLGCLGWVWRVGLSGRPARVVIVGWAAIWALLCGPANVVEYKLLEHIGGHGLKADLFMVAAPLNLYILIAAFGLQLYVIQQVTGQSTLTALRDLVGRAPTHVRQLAGDAANALSRRPGSA